MEMKTKYCARMRLRKISFSLAINNKTEPEEMVAKVEEIIRLLRERKITDGPFSAGGIVMDTKGESD
jgi:hypothetical protein